MCNSSSEILDGYILINNKSGLIQSLLKLPLNETDMEDIKNNYVIEDYTDEYVFPGLLDLNVDLLETLEWD